MNLFLLTVCLLVSATVGLPTSQRRMVLSVDTTTQAQVDILKRAQDNDHELDFWTHPRLDAVTDVMVPAQRFNQLKNQWAAAGMNITVSQEDVDALIQNTNEASRRFQLQGRASFGTTLNHNFYRSYDNYIDDLRSLKQQYGSLMEFDESGNSVPRERTIQDRIIHFIELGANMGSTPVIMMEVNIHAREWLTSSSTFYAIDWMLTNYGTDSDATFLLNNYHFVIIPVANPDGYEYSRTSSSNSYRLWRKNRRYIGGFFNCYGVDLNRNFNAFWQGSGSCTSDSYPGTTYNSEPETRAVESIYDNFQNRMVIYLSVHCYSQIMLLPWSYQQTSSVVDAKHRDFGNVMAAAMEAESGRRYGVGTAYSTIGYNAAGTSGDWALVKQENLNSNFISIAYELRPAGGAGTGGFIQPSSEIVPSGKELVASLVAAGRKYVEDYLS